MGTTLSSKNCHRAANVVLVSNPEKGIWNWQYDSVQIGSGFSGYRACKAVNIESGEEITVMKNQELSAWEVVEWAYERDFEDLYKIAVDAFYMTSHTPEERALQYIRDYEAEVNADLSQMPEQMHEEYYASYRAKITDLFHKHSRIMSAAITGPARFPTEKNRRHNDSYDSAVQEFVEWRKRQLKRAESLKESMKPQEQRDAEELARIKKDIVDTAGTIFQIDTGKCRGYSRSCFVTNLAGRLETLSRNTSPEIFSKVMEFIKDLGDKFKENGGKPIFTARHKVWTLAEKAKEAKAKAEERAQKEDVEIEFAGGKIVKCYSEDRLQIFHNEKPSYDVIDSLKHNGFKWSRFNGCWQRQLTDNAYYGAARVLAGKDSTFDEHKEWVNKLRNAN